MVYEGIITAIATPFQKGDAIDYDAFKALLVAQKQAGISGVMVSGTTGESPTLLDDECEKLVEIALSESTDAFKVYVGIGCNNTKKSIQKALALKKRCPGIHGMMAVVPYYNKPSQQGLFEHFRAIAEELGDTPLCVYNVPGRTSCSIMPQTFVQLALRCKNIVALKEASGDMNVIAETRMLLNQQGCEHVRILSGDDATFAPSLVAGACGAISVSAHIVPWAMVEMLDAWKQGDVLKLQKLHLATRPLHTALFLAANPVPLKWLLGRLGYGDGSVRLPLVELEESLQQKVFQVFQNVAQSGIKVLQQRGLA